MTQPSLFDVEPEAKRRKPRAAKHTPAWTSSTTKAICFDCIELLAAGKWVTPKRAQWRRELEGAIALYCYEHAVPVRDADHKATMAAAA
jgi:hypothetical protein